MLKLLRCIIRPISCPIQSTRKMPVHKSTNSTHCSTLTNSTWNAAYKKGVELTMNGLLEILGKLGVTVYGEPGDVFSPDEHNAVMHIEDENYKEGEIVAVFQKGFKLGDKVIRFAMVQTAN